jgi:hypothetical protein
MSSFREYRKMKRDTYNKLTIANNTMLKEDKLEVKV